MPITFAPPAMGTRYGITVRHALSDRRIALDRALELMTNQTSLVAEAADRLVQTLSNGQKVLVAGNGGSAAEAQHFAAELVGRFMHDRAPYAVLSLTADTSILTAVSNDYGYRQIFARQVAAFGQPGDLLVTFSTSGESENLIEATIVALRNSMTVIALTGERPSSLGQLADLAIRVPSVDTATTQELHMLLTHVLCGIVESELSLHDGLAG